MTPEKNVQDTHISPQQLRTLHDALIAIVSVINRPEPDAALIRAAGIALDRALFPLLVVIERLGPIGIVDLAERAGRDYTTVSRQVSKLESLGLVARQASSADARVRMAGVTDKGRALTDRLDAARGRLAQQVFASWDARDVAELVRLMDKLAAAMSDPARFKTVE